MYTASELSAARQCLDLNESVVVGRAVLVENAVLCLPPLVPVELPAAQSRPCIVVACRLHAGSLQIERARLELDSGRRQQVLETFHRPVLLRTNLRAPEG